MKKIPKLRFKEFTDEWEEKKLKNIVEVNPRTEELPDEFIYIDLESVENGVLKEKKIIQKENAPSRAKRNVKLNDILYQTVRPYQQNNLFFNFDDEFEYIASTGYAQLRSTKNNSKYIYHMLHTKKFLDKVLERCTGTSYPAINSNDLSEINVFYSPFLEEQKKIGNFFSSVDKKISIMEEKLNLFEEYKKGIMQKIFNQELKFKNENGNDYPEWEEKALGEIGEFKNGVNKGKNDFGSGYPFINLLDIFGKCSIDNNKDLSLVRVTDKELKEFNLLRGDTLFVRSSVKPDGVGLTTVILNDLKDTVYSGFIIRFRETENLLSLNYKKYCFYEESFRRNLLNKSTVSANTNINQDNLKILTIKLPCLEEQKKIADFLSAIDSKIEKLSDELENLKKFKKGLLQKMFV